MSINFPANPNSGDTYAYNNVTWSWNTYAWDKVSDGGGSGSAGATGPTGPQGNTGATGPVGDYVSSFGGKTGTVGAGITNTQILYWSGADATGSNNFTFDGTDVVTLASTGHYTGRLLGPVLVPIKNSSGVSIPKGTPVYATGSVGASGQVEVAACDASDSAKMPAIGLTDDVLGVGDIGHAVVFGNLEQVDTSGYTINGTVYIASGGGVTGTKPTGANDLIQNIGRVIRVHPSTGDILVSAIGRSNDVPNILQARSWLQMPDGMTATGLVKSFNGLTGAVTGVTTSAANTFTALQAFNVGITASGATFTNNVRIANLYTDWVYESTNSLNLISGTVINVNSQGGVCNIGDTDAGYGSTTIVVDDTTNSIALNGAVSTGVSVTSPNYIDDFSNIQTYQTTTTATTANQTIATISGVYSAGIMGYPAFEVTISAQDTVANKTEILKMLVVHDGTNTTNTQYGLTRTGTAVASAYTTTLSGGANKSLLVRATPSSTNSTKFTVTVRAHNG